MTWNSGACRVSPDGGAAWISADAYPEPVRIADAEVRADNAEVADDLRTTRPSSE